MIGALLLKFTWKHRVEKAFAHRDIDALVGAWSEDGVLEFGGTSSMAGRFVGRPEIRGWMERWFARVADLKVTIGKVALTNPWALGLTNTVMYQEHIEETSHDGLSISADLVSVITLHRGRITLVRDYLFDETPELAMWGPHRATA